MNCTDNILTERKAVANRLLAQWRVKLVLISSDLYILKGSRNDLATSVMAEMLDARLDFTS